MPGTTARCGDLKLGVFLERSVFFFFFYFKRDALSNGYIELDYLLSVDEGYYSVREALLACATPLSNRYNIR